MSIISMILASGDRDLVDAAVHLMTVVTAVLVILTPVFVEIARRIQNNSRDVKRMSVRQEELGRVQIQRGRVELASKGYGRLPKPLGHKVIITPVVRELFDVPGPPNVYGGIPVAEGLKRLAMEPAPLADSISLVIRINQVYGGWLVENICLPLGVHQFGCLAAAEAIANEEHDRPAPPPEPTPPPA